MAGPQHRRVAARRGGAYGTPERQGGINDHEADRRGGA